MKKLLAAALLAAAVSGCGTHAAAPAAQAPAAKAVTAQASTKFQPIIHYITANGQMGQSFIAPPNYNIRLQAYATGDGPLTFNWQGWGIIMGFGDWANWVTPMMPGTYTVQLQARDNHGGLAWQTLWFTIRQRATLAPTELSAADKASAKGPEAK
ncbi:MAG: hypothetical protein JWM80_2339 [Cyanobacteria bacterium RYN_339]|nr:hypothetical protein [Cyanobacteria bacterium RYN_339]